MSAFIDALRAEPVMRRYLLASIADDVGIAASGWAWQLTLATLFVDQRTRASVMIPALACFLVGALLGGPLADWRGKVALREGIARHRWRILILGRGVETLMLSVMALRLMDEQPSIPVLLPYFLISALMKTLLRPTRIALEVDLLSAQRPGVQANGEPILDETGHPLWIKEHLLLFASWLSAASAAAGVVGFALGGEVLAAAGGRVWVVLLVDVVSNVVFLVVVGMGCKPPRVADGAPVGSPGLASAALREMAVSVKTTVSFLVNKSRRPLLLLVVGAVIIEMVAEAYDGKMVLKQILRASDDELRRSELTWMLAALVCTLLVPVVAKKAQSLGVLFVACMAADSIVMVFAGHAAEAGSSSLVPFTALLALDRGLTSAAGALAGYAMSAASSAALRGRLIATFVFAALVADLASEALATGLSESIGIPAMITRLGYAQGVMMLIFVLIGGRMLWRYR